MIDDVIKSVSPDDANKRSRRAKQVAEAQARLRARRATQIERMKRIVTKAQQLNDSLKAIEGEQLTLPLSLVSPDVEQTLDNLQSWINTTQHTPKKARGGTKRRRDIDK